ncbi:MAG: L,D-transpeptidase family protein [Streptosporangiaceae bacterium]
MWSRHHADRPFHDHSFHAGLAHGAARPDVQPGVFIGTAYAIHGDTYVPLQPVSHGCVRIPMDIAAFFHTLVKAPGTPVYIYD